MKFSIEVVKGKERIKDEIVAKSLEELEKKCRAKYPEMRLVRWDVIDEDLL